MAGGEEARAPAQGTVPAVHVSPSSRVSLVHLRGLWLQHSLAFTSDNRNHCRVWGTEMTFRQVSKKLGKFSSKWSEETETND